MARYTRNPGAPTECYMVNGRVAFRRADCLFQPRLLRDPATGAPLPGSEPLRAEEWKSP